MARNTRQRDRNNIDHSVDLDGHSGNPGAVPSNRSMNWPFPADWRNVKPQTQRERLADIEDAPF